MILKKLSIYLPVLLGILILPFLSLEPIQAQSEINIRLNELALDDFPQSLTFRLQADHDTPITDIDLRYGIEGLTCQEGGSLQFVDIEPGTDIEAEWQWELWRVGALPSGVTVWWQWQITDEAGNQTTLERTTLELVDDAHDWRTLSEEDVTVYWYEGNITFGQAILQEATTSVERIAQELGVTSPGQIEIWIYPSSLDVRDALINVPEWTGGVAYPQYDITVVGIAPGQYDWAAQVIPHELTHLIVEKRLFNCRGIDLPTWLNEGLARHSEGELNPTAAENLRQQLADNNLPPLRSLARGFSAYSDAANISYTQSATIVKYMLSTFGPAKMDELLTTMQAGNTINTALEMVYGFDTDGLDATWRMEMGYQATPTAEADALALQATATLVPTRPLGGIPQVQATATPVVTATATAVSTTTPSPQPTTLPPVTPKPTPAPLPTETTPTTEPTEASPASSPLSLLVIFSLIGILTIVTALITWRSRSA